VRRREVRRNLKGSLFTEKADFCRSATAPLADIAEKTHSAAAIGIYESAVQVAGRFGAVYERDDQTAYFYLLDLQKTEGRQIISALILIGPPG